MRNPTHSRLAFDPHLGRVVSKSDTSSPRIRAKLSNPYTWCFCELCWRPTEYSALTEAPVVIERLQRGNAKLASLSSTARAAAQKKADTVVAHFEKALTGALGPYEAGRIYYRWYDAFEMRGDRSVASFRDRVERMMLLREWARQGDLVWPNRPNGQAGEGAKPSKLYCEAHNPKRSAEARRAYQRDRKFSAEFESLMDQIWSRRINNGDISTWDIEAHADVRREAYRSLQVLKSPTKAIDDFLASGTTNQTEIARKLGISRQAVSAAIKRRAEKQAKSNT